METVGERFDVVVVGAGPAGLSGALVLARSRRSVLVLGSGPLRNAPAVHVHNFLTREGVSPAEVQAIGSGEVRRYGGQVEEGYVAAVRREGDHFAVETGDGTVRARRILIATGLRDELPNVPGLAARWGIDVLHCPYCHGWEVRDQRIGVLATGPMTTHQSLLFRQLSPHVQVLQHTGPALSVEQREQLDAMGISLVTGEVVKIEAGSGRLAGVHLSDGSHVPLDALVVAPRFAAHAEALAPLGLKSVDLVMGGHVLGTHIEADAAGLTDIPGVWVAGNVTDLAAQVVTSAAAGLVVGAAINSDRIAEDIGAAVQAHRHELTGTVR